MFSHRKLLLDNIGGQNKLNKKEIQKNKTESKTQFHIFYASHKTSKEKLT